MGADVADGLLPELKRLDPWAFCVAPGSDLGADFLVIGLTGAFVVFVNQEKGYVTAGFGRIDVGGNKAASPRRLRSAAKKLKSRLSSMSVYADVEPVLCCTDATIGAPRKVKGVWIASPSDAVKLMARRPNAVPRPSAKRAAQTLGAKMPPARRGSEDDQ